MTKGESPQKSYPTWEKMGERLHFHLETGNMLVGKEKAAT